MQNYRKASIITHCKSKACDNNFYVKKYRKFPIKSCSITQGSLLKAAVLNKYIAIWKYQFRIKQIDRKARNFDKVNYVSKQKLPQSLYHHKFQI